MYIDILWEWAKIGIKVIRYKAQHCLSYFFKEKKVISFKKRVFLEYMKLETKLKKGQKEGKKIVKRWYLNI